MLKAAIIGAGFISEFHGDAYRENPDVTLCAVCDVDGEKAQTLAQKMGCKAYTDAKTMLETEQPQIVSICLPTFLHEEYTILALEHGANVLCEKPMAITMDRCRRMADAAKKSGKLLMVAQVLRFWPEFVQIAKTVERLGQPKLVSMQRLQHCGRLSTMLDPEKGGGALFDLFVHDLDYVCSLFGTDVKVEAASGFKGPQNSWRSLCCMLRWKSGVTAKLEASNIEPAGFPFTAALRADYEDAGIQYRFRAPVNIQKDAKTDTEFLVFENGEVIPQLIPEKAQSQAFANEIAAFVRAVQTGKSPLPVEETLRVMEVVQMVKTALEAQE